MDLCERCGAAVLEPMAGGGARLCERCAGERRLERFDALHRLTRVPNERGDETESDAHRDREPDP